MIRAALVGIGTVVGVGAVLGYQPAVEVPGLAAPEQVPPASTATPAAAPSEAPAPGPEDPSAPAAAPSTSRQPATRPAGPAAPSPSAGGATARPSTAASPTAAPTPSRSSEPTPSPTRPPSSTSPTPTPTPTPEGPRTYSGAAAATPYGTVQVALVVDDGVIVDAYALQFPAEHPTSREIATYALPELRRQTLEAQSAQIAGVSGASYDTAGWITSLQSALSKADL